MINENLLILFYYRKTNIYGLNVVLGALETSSYCGHLEIRLIMDSKELVENLMEAVQQKRKALVCWSFFSPKFFECRRELKSIRKQVDSSHIVHIAGGVHATAEPEATLRAGFDLVAIGEGEKTIINLVSQLEDVEKATDFRGIAYLSDDRYISKGAGEQINLDDFPPFAPGNERFNPIEITRGCIYTCKFCQTPFMFKARFRHRSIENVCYYVRVMKSHGLKDIRFITPTSLSYGSTDESVNIDKVENLLSSVRNIIGTNGRIFFGTFPSEVRPEHVSKEVLSILKKYVDNDNIIIGGQSGSERVLNISKRGHNVEVIISSVRLALEAGFIPNVDIIFGLPGETSKDTEATLKLAENLSEMGARIHGHTFIPLPGTPFKNVLPGKISKSVERKISQLTSQGKLYGHWKKQVTIAQQLSDFSQSKTKRLRKTIVTG